MASSLPCTCYWRQPLAPCTWGKPGVASCGRGGWEHASARPSTLSRPRLHAGPPPTSPFLPSLIGPAAAAAPVHKLRPLVGWVLESTPPRLPPLTHPPHQRAVPGPAACVQALSKGRCQRRSGPMRAFGVPLALLAVLLALCCCSGEWVVGAGAPIGGLRVWMVIPPLLARGPVAQVGR